MTPEQIKQWAAEAKIDLEHQVSLSREPVWIATDDELTRFAALVAQHERESCALVCDASAMRCETAAQDAIENNEPDEVSNLRSTAWQITVCAAKILARGEKP